MNAIARIQKERFCYGNRTFGRCALEKAFEVLKEERGRRFIVAFTAGKWDEEAAIAYARKPQKAEIEIGAIGFGSADEAFLRKSASSDENTLFSNLSRLGEGFSTIAQTIRTSTELSL